MLGPFATGTNAGELTGTISVHRFDGGTNADSSHFLRGDGIWATVGEGAGGGAQTVVDFGYLDAGSASDNTFIPNGSATAPSTSASNPNNLKISFTVTTAQVVFVDLFAILARTGGLTRVAILDTAGNWVWPKRTGTMVYSRPTGESNTQTLQFTAAIPVSPGSYAWVVKAEHALSVGTATWYDRMFRVQYR